ncbi:MAG: thioredoxin family protein [Mycoplasmatales bacterium]
MKLIYLDNNIDINIIKDSHVLFVGTNCPVCNDLLETLKNIKKEYTMYIINAHDNQQLTQSYLLTAVPCILTLKDNKVIDKAYGNKSKEFLLNYLEENE